MGSDVAAEAFAGSPSELHLCDSAFNAEKTLEVEYVQQAAGLNLRASKHITPDELKTARAAFTQMLGEGASKVALTL